MTSWSEEQPYTTNKSVKGSITVIAYYGGVQGFFSHETCIAFVWAFWKPVAVHG